jgi:hypothetical protein
LLPLPENLAFYEYYPIAIITLIISLGVFGIYLRIRNSFFQKRINNLISNHQSDIAKDMVERAIKGHPKTRWLQIEKALLFGYSGNTANFYSSYDVLMHSQKHQKNPMFFQLLVMKIAIDMVLKKSYNPIESKYIQSKNWGKYVILRYEDVFQAVKCFEEKDYKQAIFFANRLQDTKTNFFKYIGSFILCNSYKAIGELEMSETYRKTLCANELYNAFES